MLSCFGSVQLFATLWTVAHQAPLSMGFSRQEYWRGLPCPPPRDLPNPGIEPSSLMSPALAGRFFTTSTTWEALKSIKKTNLQINFYNIAHIDIKTDPTKDFIASFCKLGHESVLQYKILYFINSN